MYDHDLNSLLTKVEERVGTAAVRRRREAGLPVSVGIGSYFRVDAQDVNHPEWNLARVRIQKLFGENIDTSFSTDELRGMALAMLEIVNARERGA